MPLRGCAELGFAPLRSSAELGFAHLRRYAELGFTLVEMMVVIVIIGLASAAVVVAMPDAQGRVRDEAERFAARALAVRDDAIAQGRTESVVVTARGYYVEQRSHGRWQNPLNPAFGRVDWREGTLVALGPSGQARATFDSTGAADEALSLVLARNGAKVRVVVATDGMPHVAR